MASENTQCENISVGFVGGAYIELTVSKEFLGWDLEDGEIRDVTVDSVLMTGYLLRYCGLQEGGPQSWRLPYSLRSEVSCIHSLCSMKF